MKLTKILSNYLLRSILLSFLSNATFAADSEHEKWRVQYDKNKAMAEAKCGTDSQITVQLNRGGSVTGTCLVFFVGDITMRIGERGYSFAVNRDIAEISEATKPNIADKSSITVDQLGSFEVKRLDSNHAIGIRFFDANLVEDPFKFGKIALNYEFRFWFLSLFLEGGADFKAGLAQSSKKYDGMIQLRWLFSKAFESFYFGGFLNYQEGVTTLNDADSQKRDIQIRAYSPGLLIGKKWIFAGGIFLDFTFRAGPYFETIVSRAPNFKFTTGDDITTTTFRGALGGLALTLSVGYVF